MIIVHSDDAILKSGGSAARSSSRRRLADWLDARLPQLFLVPGVLCLILVIAYPVAYNLITSVTDASLIYPGISFVGLENFTATLGDRAFWIAALRTLQWTVFSVVGQLFVGLVAALALEQMTAGRTVFRLALIVPWAFPAIVMAFGWRFILDPLYGVANHMLSLIGLIDAPLAFLSERPLAMPIVILMNIWFGFPFMMVAIIAGLAAIPRELYEAAQIDGANYWQELRYVTLPALWQIISVLVVLRTIWVFNNFEFIFLTTGGGPVDATTTLPIYAFQVGWQRYDLGRMASVAIVMIVLLSLLLALYVRLLGKSRADAAA
jgi:multiple sugar transport system permease protein